jgi:hypothetical protein
MRSIDRKKQADFPFVKYSCVTVNRSIDKTNQRGQKVQPRKLPIQGVKVVTQLSKVKSQTNFDFVGTSGVRCDEIKKPAKTKTLKSDLLSFKPVTAIHKKLSRSELVQMPVSATKDIRIDSRSTIGKMPRLSKAITTQDLNILLEVEKLLFEFLRLTHHHQDIYDHFKVYIDFVQEHNFEPILVDSIGVFALRRLKPLQA